MGSIQVFFPPPTFSRSTRRRLALFFVFGDRFCPSFRAPPSSRAALPVFIPGNESAGQPFLLASPPPECVLPPLQGDLVPCFPFFSASLFSNGLCPLLLLILPANVAPSLPSRTLGIRFSFLRLVAPATVVFQVADLRSAFSSPLFAPPPPSPA